MRMTAEEGAQYTRSMRQKLGQLDGYLAEKSTPTSLGQPAPESVDIGSSSGGGSESDRNPFKPRVELPNSIEYNDKVSSLLVR